MHTTDMQPGLLNAAIATLAGRGPVCLVNFLRYRKSAEYGAGSASASSLPACSGKEAYYTRYLPAFGAIPGAQLTKIVWLGNAQAMLVAPDGETWDDIAIVEYPTLEVLRDIVDNPRYESEAAPHRLAALEDWRFVVATPASPPT